jgi:hypothetical protein
MEHAARGLAWAQAIEQSAIAQAVRESLWFYPFANTTHVLAMAMLVGAIVVFDLRVLGVLGAGRAADAARMALPVARLGFVLAVPSGVAMFIAEATAYLANPVFLIKLGAIAAAVLNLALFHAGSFRRIDAWPDRAPPMAARRAAAASLSAWTLAAVCGRLAAYF